MMNCTYVMVTHGKGKLFKNKTVQTLISEIVFTFIDSKYAIKCITMYFVLMSRRSYRGVVQLSLRISSLWRLRV